MLQDDRVKLNIFEGCTTYTNDYRYFAEPLKREQHLWPKDRFEKPEKPPPVFPYCDNETYRNWREDTYVPFNLLWEPKPIIGENPHEPFTIQKEPIDTGKEDAIKTRPRLYTSPAVSMDDIPDPEMRKLLCQHMYTSDWKKASEEAASGITTRIPNNTTVEKDRDVVGFVVDTDPCIDSKLRALGKKWDKPQIRATIDPTETFWLTKDPPVKCGACENPFKGLVPEATKNKISKLIKEDNLRFAHDYLCPSYAGYKPRLSAGVNLSKIEKSVTHPYCTNLQAISKRFAGDYTTK